MNCCECDKKIDLNQARIPARWFEKREGDKLVKVICSECIKEPEKLERWRKD